jgi:hypothetical protein
VLLAFPRKNLREEGCVLTWGFRGFTPQSLVSPASGVGPSE